MSWPNECEKMAWNNVPDGSKLLGLWPIGIRGHAMKKNGVRWLAKKDRPAKNISMSEFSVHYAEVSGVWYEVTA